MADNGALIKRALAIHLLREGQFSVASTFLHEEQDRRLAAGSAVTRRTSHRTDDDGDDEMRMDGESESDTADADKADDEADNEDDNDGGDVDRDAAMHTLSEDLQDRFSEMYGILAQLKQRNLTPAIEWARVNNARLETKGSNLEFELCKLQYIWLFKGPGENGLPDDAANGQRRARAYAHSHLSRFQSRHLHEIQQLACALVYASNLDASPYRQVFEINSAFDDVAVSFTRDFCSLLGLSAESPMYMAVTAGSIALPRLIKYTAYMREKKTEWTTENELAFETPLPESMIYHPIFVCPVSKEQTTDQNPAMMLPCGHVVCRDSLHRIAKGSRYKCPYCPTEGHLRDAMKITF